MGTRGSAGRCSVWDAGSHSGQSTTSYFTAYAGSNPIEGQARTAHNQDRSFRFTIGLPSVPGGVDRIKIQVCLVDDGIQTWCSDPVMVHRD
jgi:hypothetical protein